ncbi:cytochrome P450 [Sphaerisporangium corydalis]|uniref:Cytochrome P450 n=1 Tax=Sphaerisporangium corydalis TaxID=1441875 RepID=A0ABV9ECN3_9ACTN|nr:cytochrome P450 [Sphaerisporangium corydalis]
MTHALPSPVTLPLERQNPFDPPSELRRWSHEGPLRPMLYADGHVGWLVTGYSAVRSVLGDARFSADPDLVHPQIGRRSIQRFLGKLPGLFLNQDPPEHTRLRRMVAGHFGLRNMKRLEPTVTRFTSGLLDGMEQGGPSADLVSAFAFPLPSMVICELLGVPYSAHDQFQRQSSEMLSLESRLPQVRGAIEGMALYIHDLVDRKRAEPGDDLISDLVSTGELTKDEITGVAMLLLVSGHETTANMIALGTFTLLENPVQLAVLRDDPALTGLAVEELLRYLSIIHMGLVRAASEDVEVEGYMIKAGESVTVSLATANRDPRQFAEPDRLDITRPATGHLAFGHGIHQCVGQQLARMEMRIAYPALLNRFPKLRLAVTPEQVATRSDMAIYGVHRLPVAW